MLAYRFTAVYSDGSEYQQNAADVSATDPQRSCYYDVDQSRLSFFFLEGGGRRYGVSLEDGSFWVDDARFRMHDGDLSGFRLVFFRRHKHSLMIGSGERGHETVYRFGWQATDADGSNVQRIMEIA